MVAQFLSAFALVCVSAQEEGQGKENREESGRIPGMIPGSEGMELFGGEMGEEAVVVEGRWTRWFVGMEEGWGKANP